MSLPTSSPALINATYADGVQPWSAGPLYPWVDTITVNFETGLGRIWMIHPDGRTTQVREFQNGTPGSLALALDAAWADARKADALRACNRAIAEASNVYDLFAALIERDEVQICS